jgi:hypothetical protein
VGKRSRKRGGLGSDPAAESAPAHATTRAERDAARRRRAAATASGQDRAARSQRRERSSRGRPTVAERPPAPWGSFPLVEIVVLIALVLIVSSFFVGGVRGGTMLLAGLALGSLAGLELSIREHFAGYRSHSMLLAGAVALVAMVLTFVIGGASGVPVLILPVAVIVFAVAFWWFRRAFSRRTGGVSFR